MAKNILLQQNILTYDEYMKILREVYGNIGMGVGKAIVDSGYISYKSSVEQFISRSVHYMAEYIDISDDEYVEDMQKAYEYVKDYKSSKQMIKGLAEAHTIMTELWMKYYKQIYATKSIIE